MHRSTLVVDEDDGRRRQVVHAFSRRGLRYLDVADAFGAMAALGRADFGVVVANEGRRTLSLRGLCQLARRRHPDILILIIHREGSDPAAIPEILGVPVEILPPTTSPDELAAIINGALADAVDTARAVKGVISSHTSSHTDSGDGSLDVDVDVVVDDDPTVKTRIAPAPPDAPPHVALPAADALQAPRRTDPLIVEPLPEAPRPPARPPAWAPAFVEDQEPTLRLPVAPAAAPAFPSPPSTPVLPAPPPLPAEQPPRAAALPASVPGPLPTLAPPQPSAPRSVAHPPPLTRVPAGDVVTTPDGVFNLGADEPTERMARSPSPPPDDPAIPEALLEGLLDGASGPALLMGVFAQELTGRLTVKDGPAAGTLYFYRGEPVWADDPLGDVGLHRRLVQRGRLKPDAQLDRVPQGQLLGSLVQKGLLTGQQMHEFMRELVRDFVLALANAKSGAYRFDEDKKFLEVAPLLKVNPFGLILESRRRSTPPPELLTLSNTIADQFVIPQPGLVSAADKIAPFVRGARLGRVADGTRTTRQILEATSIDSFMGTLVMITLRDARLIQFEDAPHAAAAGGVTLTDAALSDEPREITLVDAEIPSAPDGSSEDTAVREEIFQLYMRLKPLTVPRQVLGVALDAGMAEVEAAYRARMRELDPKRIPEGSAQQLLAARVEELARKVANAYQAVKLQISGADGSGPMMKTGKTNPF